MSFEPGSPADWLRYARSDLSVSQGPAAANVLRETLCFHAQQAAEKSIKAVLLCRSVQFPRTHNLKILLDLLPSSVVVPPWAARAAELSDYAVTIRYPGVYEEITEDEYEAAVLLAEMIVLWAEGIVGAC